MGAVFGVCYRDVDSQAPLTQEEVTAPATQEEATAPPADVQTTTEESDWVKLGGGELESPLRDGLVKCLDSKYLVERARRGEPLRRCQDMPDEAYIGLDKLKAVGVYSKRVVEANRYADYQWLPLMIVSYAWLSPSHPDPFGETLQVVAKALESMELHGVIIDFTALPQAPRTDAENATFKLGLPSLNRFYSHPHVIVLKVSQFPEGYPQSRPYDIPEGYSPVEYSGRGWCYAEAAMAGLGKSPKFVCDVCRLSPGEHVVGGSVVLPQPPLTPENFNVELGTKTFTQPAADVARVQNLYRSAFVERIQSSKSLKYANLAWGPAQVTIFAEAILENNIVEEIDLSMNPFGLQGMNALRQVIHSQTLKILRVGECSLLHDGVREIVEGLKSDSTLVELDIAKNGIGDEGARATGEALKLNSTLKTLWLHENSIGGEGARSIGEGLKLNSALKKLYLHENSIGDEGARSIGEGLKLNSALEKLYLNKNRIGDEGARSIGEGLKLNSALKEFYLWENQIGGGGARAIGEALKLNCTLEKMDLDNNHIGDEGAHGIGEGLKLNSALKELLLQSNNIGAEGVRAIGEALTINTAFTRLKRTNGEILAWDARDTGEASGHECCVKL